MAGLRNDLVNSSLRLQLTVSSTVRGAPFGTTSRRPSQCFCSRTGCYSRCLNCGGPGHGMRVCSSDFLNRSGVLKPRASAQAMWPAVAELGNRECMLTACRQPVKIRIKGTSTLRPAEDTPEATADRPSISLRPPCPHRSTSGPPKSGIAPAFPANPALLPRKSMSSPFTSSVPRSYYSPIVVLVAS